MKATRKHTGAETTLLLKRLAKVERTFNTPQEQWDSGQVAVTRQLFYEEIEKFESDALGVNIPQEVFIASSNGGCKTDGGKLRLDLIEPEFKRAMADILSFGMEKYGAYNWRGLNKKRVIASLERHLQEYREGQVMDTQSPNGFNLAAVAVNAMFAMMLDLHGDDEEWRTEKED